MRKRVTDEDVQKTIDYMRKRAGSDDLHAMIRAYKQDHVDEHYWYDKTYTLVSNVVFVLLMVVLALSGALGFYFWIASVLPPLWVGVVGMASGVLALVLHAAVVHRGN